METTTTLTGKGNAPCVQFQLMHGAEDCSTTGYPACDRFRDLIARVNNGERDPRCGDWSLRPVMEDGTTYAGGWETITRNARGEYYGQTTTGAGNSAVREVLDVTIAGKRIVTHPRVAHRRREWNGVHAAYSQIVDVYDAETGKPLFRNEVTFWHDFSLADAPIHHVSERNNILWPERMASV